MKSCKVFSVNESGEEEEIELNFYLKIVMLWLSFLYKFGVFVYGETNMVNALTEKGLIVKHKKQEVKEER